MLFPAFSMDYYASLPQECYYQNLTSQYMKMALANKELQEKNTLLMKKISTLENQSLIQKKEIKELRKLANKKEKRKYSKRRIGLQKKFACRFKDCQNKYSSQVALNSHMKRKHQHDEFSTQ